MVTASRLRVLGRTLSNMGARQLTGIVERTGRNHLLPVLPVDLDSRYEGPPPDAGSMRTTPVVGNLDALTDSVSDATKASYRARVTDAANSQMTVLNRTVDLSGTPVAWDHPDIDRLPRLWRLKLHGFEPLRWLVLSVPPDSELGDRLADRFTEWVVDWHERHRIGEAGYLRRNWAPYAVSQRLVNWCHFCAWLQSGGHTQAPELRAGIRKNASFLSDHVEHDVGGNHLIANGHALVAAGTILPDGGRLIEQGLDVLVGSTDQFLPDGGPLRAESDVPRGSGDGVPDGH